MQNVSKYDTLSTKHIKRTNHKGCGQIYLLHACPTLVTQTPEWFSVLAQTTYATCAVYFRTPFTESAFSIIASGHSIGAFTPYITVVERVFRCFPSDSIHPQSDLVHVVQHQMYLTAEQRPKKIALVQLRRSRDQ